jgi:chemotaxis protein MotB
MQRANHVRTLFTAIGMDQNRVARITGHGDREHRVRNPMSMRNNRIEIVFLRQN